jgi:antitoxin HicB
MQQEKKMTKFKYPVTIRPLTKAEGGGFLAEFPDLPGCMADGETIEEALIEAQDALTSWIETSKELNHPIPKPNNKNKSSNYVQRLPNYLHKKLINRAVQEGVSLNTLVIAFLAECLNSKINKKLLSK